MSPKAPDADGADSGAVESGAAEAPATRPDTDDYDLLTFGEVAARLDEEVKDLERARDQAAGDQRRVEQLDARIALLKSSGDQYQQEQRSKDAFIRRFGAALSTPSDQRPHWQ